MSVTQKDISVHLGITRVTVARALTGGKVSERTRLRVRDAAKALGYTSSSNREARQLIAKRYGRQILTDVVAVILPPLDAPVRDSAFFGPLLEGIEHEAEVKQLDTVICVARPRGLPEIILNGVDGVITLVAVPDLDVYLRGLSLPVVATSFASHASLHAVLSEDRQGISLVMQYLHSLGHRKIGYCGYPPHTLVSEGRLGAYQDEMTTRGLPLDSRFVTLGIWQKDTVEYAVGELLARATRPGERLPEFTAMVCYNDHFASFLVGALQRRGIRVPEDVSVTGYDATTFVSKERPMVTSVDFDRVAMGRIAVDILCRVRSNEDADSTRVIERVPVTLLVLETTAPVREPT